MRVHSALLVLLAIAACRDPVLPTTTALHLRGVVSAAGSGAPIAGTTVALSWPAGAFGTGANVVFTDNLGAYSIDQDFGGTAFSCTGMGLAAQASGFQTGLYAPGSIQCVQDVQMFNFALTQ